MGSIVQNEDIASVSNGSSGNPQEEEPLGDWDLHVAICWRESEACLLRMLARRELPQLNAVSKKGQMIQDSQGRRVQFPRAGITVLHVAAQNGLADVCRAILSRPDFTEAHRRENGKRADDIARLNGVPSVADMIERHLRD